MHVPALAASALLSLSLACAGAPGPPPAGATGAPTASAPAPPPPSAPGRGASPAMIPVARGQSPLMLGESSEVVLTDGAGLAAWLERLSPGSAAPAVDFATHVVVAVDGPDGSNGCHAVRITSVTLREGRLHVDVARHVPGPSQVCTMAMVRPYDAVAVATGGERLDAGAEFSWRTVTGPAAP